MQTNSKCSSQKLSQKNETHEIIFNFKLQTDQPIPSEKRM